MRIALIVDVHSNLEALEVVLRDGQRCAPSDACCGLGDIVGYGPDRRRARGGWGERYAGVSMS